jgi:hypothetical protein
MTYRDDHDAALARIDALEGEVAQAREGERDARRKLAAEKAARRRLEAQLQAPPPAEPRPTEPQPGPGEEPIGPYAVILVCIVAFILTAMVGMAILD